MALYLALRIIDGALEYNKVIAQRPLLKEAIVAILIEKDRGDLII